jgi:hypothetical protein
MNPLHTILETNEDDLKDQIEKTFKKIFGIPPELENYQGSVIFDSYGETFSLDHEGNLLWYKNEEWNIITNLEEAKKLWKTSR